MWLKDLVICSEKQKMGFLIYLADVKIRAPIEKLIVKNQNENENHFIKINDWLSGYKAGLADAKICKAIIQNSWFFEVNYTLKKLKTKYKSIFSVSPKIGLYIL
ncbi:hypothetical protein R7V43_00215 [Mesomycoplasma ovipneumoniae]|uniref:hypothetical protein n=1 Tax=Mesomycoplasma ovipneumoniae TaxID=29562 RepID=UPI002963E389|nr:hypothetical protein [Mesomycoplasma ovipneumoniae]MDW2921795.1 hypothetical protein [Mesomycoplasma ovipneumoniae]